VTKLLANRVLLIQGEASESTRKRPLLRHYSCVSANKTLYCLLLCFFLSCFGPTAFAVELDFHGAEYLVVQDAQKDNVKTPPSKEQAELGVAEASAHPVTPNEWLVQYLSAYLYQARNGSNMYDNWAFFTSYAVEQTVFLDGSLASDGDRLISTPITALAMCCR